MGVSCDLLEERAIANVDVDGTIVFAVVVAVIPVNIVREVHAAGAVAMSMGRS